MWQILLGLFASTEKLISLGRIHTHKAQHCISQDWEFVTLTSNLWIPLSPPEEEDLQWWKSAHSSEGSSCYPDRTKHPVVLRCIEIGCGSLWV